MIRFRCDQCGKQMKVSSALAGNFVTCPWCKGLAQAPMPDADTETAPQAVGLPREERRPRLFGSGPTIFVGALMLYALLAALVWFVLLKPGGARSVPEEVELLGGMDAGEPAEAQETPEEQLLPDLPPGLLDLDAAGAD